MEIMFTDARVKQISWVVLGQTPLTHPSPLFWMRHCLPSSFPLPAARHIEFVQSCAVRSGLVARPSAPGERIGRNGRSRGYQFIRRSKIDRERWLRMLFNLPQLIRNRLVVVNHVFLVLTTVCVLTGSQSLYGALNTRYRYQRPD